MSRQHFSRALRPVPYWPCTVKIFVKCKTRNPKEHFLKVWTLFIQGLQRNCLNIIFGCELLAVPYWPCTVKILSDAKLGILINISWNFEPNPSSHYRGVVQKKFWPRPPDKNVQYFWQTDRQTDENKTCKSRDPKKYILKIWSHSIQ